VDELNDTAVLPVPPAVAIPVNAEARWPMATAVAVAIALQLFKPGWLLLSPRWMSPIIWSLPLCSLILADPGKIDNRSRRLRTISILLVSFVVIGALEATVALIRELIHGGPNTNSAGTLLVASAIVWIQNGIAFSLLYWEFDGGGSATRAHGLPRYPDFAFPQTLTPEVAPPGWRPRFLDYLYLGFTNATAFSPTDVMPLAPWAKALMTIQSMESLAILVLVVGRAVNVLT
jgi:hypothetical protein